jgi:hypothetical protein
MRAVKVFRIGLMLLFGVLLVLTSAGIWGCTWFPKKPILGEDARSHTADLQSWKHGVKAFQDGDFKTAYKHFDSLRHRAGEENLRRQGLYGVACTSLILTDNVEELNVAMTHWDAWSRSNSAKMEFEDPRMLTPLLERFAALYLRSTSDEETSQTDDEQIYKMLLQEKDREIQNLRHKLEALEAIHREMEEKKKEMSSP